MINLGKGLAIELIWKMPLEYEKKFLTADYALSRFPKDATVTEELLQFAIRKFYESKK